MVTKTKKSTKKENKKIAKKKNKVVDHILQVFLLSLIICIIIFCAYKIILLAVKPTDSFLVEQGKVSQEETLTGYVIRNEYVIKNSEEQKKLVQIKNEGERTSVGEAIFRYEVSNEQELNTKITELNNQIQKAMEGQTELPSSDIKALENQIENKINGIQNKNNLQEIKEYKVEINKYITKKAKISGELSPSGAYINNLINERASIEKQLSSSSKYETSKIGGIVSYRVDGLEEKLTPNNFQELSIKSLEDLNLTTGQIVSSSDISAKIINNFECYIAVVTDTKEAKREEVGTKLKIRLSANQEIPAEVVYVSDEKNERLLVLKITQGVEYLTSYRKISLDLIWWEQEGLRVPNSSIIYENGLSYCIRTKGGILSKILVKIVKENDKYSIITNYKADELKSMGYNASQINGMRKISIYDEILADPDLDKISKELN